MQKLTDREWQVLYLSAQGKTLEQTADALGLSVDTIKTHVRRMMRRMGAVNRTHAVAIAYEQGVLGGTSSEVFRHATDILKSLLLPFMSSGDADQIVDRMVRVLTRGVRLRSLERVA